MIVVDRSSFEAVKAEMKEARILKLTAAKGRAKKDSIYEYLYSASKTLPVKVEGIIINYAVYQKFLKKLKGFEVKEKLTDDALEIVYQNFGGGIEGNSSAS